MYAYMRPRAPLANSPIALPGGRPESLQTIADVYFDVENNNNYYYYYYYDYYYYYYYYYWNGLLGALWTKCIFPKIRFSPKTKVV